MQKLNRLNFFLKRKRLFKALKIIFFCVEEFFNLCLRFCDVGSSFFIVVRRLSFVGMSETLRHNMSSNVSTNRGGKLVRENRFETGSKENRFEDGNDKNKKNRNWFFGFGYCFRPLEIVGRSELINILNYLKLFFISYHQTC
ncbi:hypothetical protein BpHYR1_021042 [Brachionus plicatilis]|uniref:Uncharacterized protein n=1 Tax=Brachionus plicatilis TaxID=10195 RepID=A0A3M7QZV8_BRAPC|nr:hypothetical protein BpHYR1_021042 [Brachionus plicatilis]